MLVIKPRLERTVLKCTLNTVILFHERVYEAELLREDVKDIP
jgi:hypothetical protein